MSKSHSGNKIHNTNQKEANQNLGTSFLTTYFPNGITKDSALQFYQKATAAMNPKNHSIRSQEFQDIATLSNHSNCNPIIIEIFSHLSIKEQLNLTFTKDYKKNSIILNAFFNNSELSQHIFSEILLNVTKHKKTSQILSDLLSKTSTYTLRSYKYPRLVSSIVLLSSKNNLLGNLNIIFKYVDNENYKKTVCDSFLKYILTYAPNNNIYAEKEAESISVLYGIIDSTPITNLKAVLNSFPTYYFHDQEFIAELNRITSKLHGKKEVIESIIAAKISGIEIDTNNNQPNTAPISNLPENIHVERSNTNRPSPEVIDLTDPVPQNNIPPITVNELILKKNLFIKYFSDENITKDKALLFSSSIFKDHKDFIELINISKQSDLSPVLIEIFKNLSTENQLNLLFAKYPNKGSIFSNALSCNLEMINYIFCTLFVKALADESLKPALIKEVAKASTYTLNDTKSLVFVSAFRQLALQDKVIDAFKLIFQNHHNFDYKKFICDKIVSYLEGFEVQHSKKSKESRFEGSVLYIIIKITSADKLQELLDTFPISYFQDQKFIDELNNIASKLEDKRDVLKTLVDKKTASFKPVKDHFSNLVGKKRSIDLILNSNSDEHLKKKPKNGGHEIPF